MYYYGWQRRKPKRRGPKKVSNGIKVRAKRGDLGQSWLAKEWISALEEATYSGSSFRRGRTYARKGQVLSVNVKKGRVVAMVQGSAQKPYEIGINVGVWGVEDLKKFAKLLKEKPIYAASILAGELPEDLADDIVSLGFNLFPSGAELSASCRCEDWAQMCKHVAAASYILAEEFDRDPLLYLKIRGINRRDFLAMLEPGAPEEPADIVPEESEEPPDSVPEEPEAPAVSDTVPLYKIISAPTNIFRSIFVRGPPPSHTKKPGSPAPPPPETTSEADDIKASEQVQDTKEAEDPGTIADTHNTKQNILKMPTRVFGGVEPGFCVPAMSAISGEQADLPSDPRRFWGRPNVEPDSYESALAPSESAALPKMLGRFPMWRGEGQFIKLMEEIYDQASLAGANAYLGIRGDAPKKARKK